MGFMGTGTCTRPTVSPSTSKLTVAPRDRAGVEPVFGMLYPVELWVASKELSLRGDSPRGRGGDKPPWGEGELTGVPNAVRMPGGTGDALRLARRDASLRGLIDRGLKVSIF